ncbi:hypothetical protein ACQEVG_16845 [Streptomyces sp. CA-135486]|uniref:hypothetical protein n=1 Tax=Streptomyces sp. CA-135486 TaxID=3240049 RepID=UPI003D9362F4
MLADAQDVYDNLKPGGRLLFSVLHTNSDGDPPSTTVTPLNLLDSMRATLRRP